MRLKPAFGYRALGVLLALSLGALVPAYAAHAHRGPTAHSSQKGKKATSPKKKGLKGQKQIDPQRATEIQAALIKSGYMSGTPTGQWDSQTTAALQKMQAENGWQTKITPDSRALIKLGLGPNNGASEGPTSSAVPVASSGGASAAGPTTVSAMNQDQPAN